jgi:hypothetical protein
MMRRGRTYAAIRNAVALTLAIAVSRALAADFVLLSAAVWTAKDDASRGRRP